MDRPGDEPARAAFAEDARRPSQQRSPQQRVYFDDWGPREPGTYVDQLALARSSRVWQRASHRDAILHHRDSLLRDAVVAEMLPKRLEEAAPVRSLRRVDAFASCSNTFLQALALRADTVKLRPGGCHELQAFTGDGGGPKAGATVECVIGRSGTWRVQVGATKTIVADGGPGSTFGLAAVLAAAGGRTLGGSGSAHAADEFTLRTSTKRTGGCECFVLSAATLKQALADYPADREHLHELLQLVQRPPNAAQQLLAALQSGDTVRAAVQRASTRRLCMPGDIVCHEGQKRPEALLLLLSGSLVLEVGGVEVRRLGPGQTFGEEILCRASPTWLVTARCLATCDLQLLHRRLLMPLVKELRGGSHEERAEASRLHFLLGDSWKKDKVILTWPLFRGYDQDLVDRVAHRIELRVKLPGARLWESGMEEKQQASHGVALYVLLYGTCEETWLPRRVTRQEVKALQSAEKKRAKRTLGPGALVGVREFLGMREASSLMVTATSLCLAAVLHRDVFMHHLECMSMQRMELQSAEVSRLLEEDLEVAEPMGPKHDHEAAVTQVPLFRGCDRRLVSRVAEAMRRLLCITGQHLCQRGKASETMFVLVRGSAQMGMDDVVIRSYHGVSVINMLALANTAYVPSFAVKCTSTAECLFLGHDDFVAVASGPNDSPLDQSRILALASAPLDSLWVAEEEGVDGEFGENCLPSIGIFRNCSMDFLLWVEDHLETALFFPGETVFREGFEDTSLYLICKGTVVVEGTETHGTQISFTSGSAFGEHRLLGFSLEASATAHVIEATTVQILHRGIFQRGLRAFPGEVGHFDRVVLAHLAIKEPFSISNVPLFRNCTKDFLSDVTSLMRTYLVHQGETMVEKGASEGKVCILRAGTAVVESATCSDEDESASSASPGKALSKYSSQEHLTAISRQSSAYGMLQSRRSSHQDQRRVSIEADHSPQDPHRKLEPNEVANFELVLGTVAGAPATIRAESDCIVTAIDATDLLRVLQNFPSEVPRLLLESKQMHHEHAVEPPTSPDDIGHEGLSCLWPLEKDMVPLFRDLSNKFLERLMEVSEWHMFFPEQNVVKQGQVGGTLFLLCYGTCALCVDGFLITRVLIPGDTVGECNLLRLRTEYTATVRTEVVSHFRTVTDQQLSTLLEGSPVEVEQFRELQLDVRAAAEAEERKLKVELAWRKLESREVGAYRAHVNKVRSTRNCSAGGGAASDSSPTAWRRHQGNNLSLAGPGVPLADEGQEGIFYNAATSAHPVVATTHFTRAAVVRAKIMAVSALTPRQRRRSFRVTGPASAGLRAPSPNAVALLQRMDERKRLSTIPAGSADSGAPGSTGAGHPQRRPSVWQMQHESRSQELRLQVGSSRRHSEEAPAVLYSPRSQPSGAGSCGSDEDVSQSSSSSSSEAVEEEEEEASIRQCSGDDGATASIHGGNNPGRCGIGPLMGSSGGRGSSRPQLLQQARLSTAPAVSADALQAPSAGKLCRGGVKGSLSSHADFRQRAIVRGRVLRALHSGRPLLSSYDNAVVNKLLESFSPLVDHKLGGRSVEVKDRQASDAQRPATVSSARGAPRLTEPLVQHTARGRLMDARPTTTGRAVAGEPAAAEDAIIAKFRQLVGSGRPQVAAHRQLRTRHLS